MIRPKKEMDLKAVVMKRYEELVARRNEVDQELKGLQIYLKAIGAVNPGRRGPEKRLDAGIREPKPLRVVADPKKAANARPKAPAKRGKGVKKVSVTETILSLIEKSEKGISIDQIRKETGFRRLTVSGVLNRMKKAAKVKSTGRGIYVKA